MAWMLILRYEVDLEIDGVSGMMAFCAGARGTKMQGLNARTLVAAELGSVCLIHHHRLSHQYVKLRRKSSLETLQDGQTATQLAFRSLDAEDIDVPRPDDRVIIPYVAFLSAFATYQKTGAYVKSVSRLISQVSCLNGSCKNIAKEELKQHVRMSEAFQNTDHGSDLEEIRNKLIASMSTSWWQKGGILTELGGHLQTLTSMPQQQSPCV